MVDVLKEPVAILLALNECSKSDTARANSLREMGYIVYTVSEADAIGLYHRASDFKTCRGLTSTVQIINDHYGADIVVILDYFRLQKGYYEYRYGNNWITHKALLLLNAGASRIILPMDKHNEMRTMLSDDISVGQYREVRYVEVDENPLWVASDSKEVSEVTQSERRTTNVNTRDRYLDEYNPFVMIS
jgi:hypothetical protein